MPSIGWVPILAKKIIFSDEAHFDLDHTLKSRRTQNESLFGADFGPEA